MTVELAIGVGARDLVPGDPDELDRLAARLDVFAGGMSDAGVKLGDVHAAGWVGPAADAFSGLVGEQPAKYREAGSAFGVAVGAIRGYTRVLRHAQADAGHAVTRFADASARSASWQRAHAAHEADVRAAAAAGDPPPAGPVPPSSDPAGGELAASRQLVADARSAVAAQGRIAAAALVAATDGAPKKPGLLHSVIGGIGDFFGGAGDVISSVWHAAGGVLEDAGGFLVDFFEDFGLDLLEIAAGALIMTAGVGMEGGGLVLDATGVGAIVGVPLNIEGVVVITAGGLLMMKGGSDLADDMANRDSDSGSSGSGRDPSGRADDTLDRTGRNIDNQKEHITDRDLDAARRELDGEVVARKPNGEPWDHVHEVRDAQNGLMNQISKLKKLLSDTGLSQAQRAEAERQLGEASRLLDHTEQFVPRP